MYAYAVLLVQKLTSPSLVHLLTIDGQNIVPTQKADLLLPRFPVDTSDTKCFKAEAVGILGKNKNERPYKRK